MPAERARNPVCHAVNCRLDWLFPAHAPAVSLELWGTHAARRHDSSAVSDFLAQRMPAMEAFIGDVVVVRQDRRLKAFQAHLISAEFAKQGRASFLLLGWLLLFHGSPAPTDITRTFITLRYDAVCLPTH